MFAVLFQLSVNVNGELELLTMLSISSAKRMVRIGVRGPVLRWGKTLTGITLLKFYHVSMAIFGGNLDHFSRNCRIAHMIAADFAYDDGCLHLSALRSVAACWL